MRILIAGATGFIGRKLVLELLQNGHELICVSRKINSTFPLSTSITWLELAKNIEENKCHGNIDAIINLSGESINGRWTKEKKEKIINSRLDSNRLLLKFARICQVKTYIASSAVGFYGDCGSLHLNESSNPGNDFLALTCQKTEDVVEKADFDGRKVVLRTGIVIGEEGGIIKKLRPFLLLKLMPLFGDGENFLSWIAIEDVVRSIHFILENNDINGPVNLTSPRPITWKEIAKKLLVTPIHLPRFLARIFMGEAAVLLVGGQRVMPQQLVEHGFIFTKSEFLSPFNIAPH